MDEPTRAALRRLPSVDDMLHDPVLSPLTRKVVPEIATRIVRRQQERARAAILNGDLAAGDRLPDEIAAELTSITRAGDDIVVNGTGVIIHTNLGRSPVSHETARAMSEHASRYQALEIDLRSGERGGRGSEVEELVRLLTGAEKTLVVNNNAAAVLLTLAATSAGRDVIVSRGDAVEIGGGFRVPDVLRQSGAHLVEVGTTNRTYVSDYESATSENTAAYLKVHASNFAVVGFTSRAELDELAQLSEKHSVLLIEDVGSGCLLDTAPFGLSHEPTLAESISAGVDVVCASGDKLLGGPQAGLIIGKAEVVTHIARHPLARAVRADKSCLAGVAATLRHYVRGDATESIPVWWCISRSADWLRERALAWKSAIDAPCLDVIRTESVVGGGSLPGRTLPSFALAIDAGVDSAQALARRLRTGTPSIVPRVVDDRVAIDARTVLQDEDDKVIVAVRSLLG